MKLKIRSFFPILKTAFKEWWSKDPFKESAVIAYYAIFSLPGLMVVIVTLAGYFFGQEVISGRLSEQISATMGRDTADQINEMITKAQDTGTSVWATIIGVVTILIGATGVFAQFQKSLNIIWEVKADESKSGIWSVIKVRLFSFGLIISIAFILMVSLVVSTMIASMGNLLQSYFYDAAVILIQSVDIIISLVILAFIFALMFKFFPDAKIRWRHVWIGSLVTAVLFELGKSALSLYFGKAEPGSGYGAAGSVILILLWVSYSSMIVFYGAEFTRAYANKFDGEIPADKNAVKDPGREK